MSLATSVVSASMNPSEIPTVARFVLASPVLPAFTEALALAERVHTYLVLRSDGAPVFRGCDDNKKPLSGHQHVHIFAETNARHDHISHLTLYAPMGFDHEAQEVLDALHTLWDYGGHDIQFVFLGLGSPEDFAGWNTRAGQCRLFESSRVWESYTPFVSTRFPKTRNNGDPRCDDSGFQIGSPPHDLLRLLRESGLPSPVSIESLSHKEIQGQRLPWQDFPAQRIKGGGRRSQARGCGFRVTFSEPVRGPIAVGYGAHFGLGLFTPIPEQ